MVLPQNPFSYATGTSATTVTVPTGQVVVGVTVLALSTGAAGLTITPNGPGFAAGTTGGLITVPAGQSFSLPSPTASGSAFELGAATVLAFSGAVASWYVQYQAAGVE